MEPTTQINATHYLRVEGVNLSAFVFDTRDLSTNRGGSLLLLDAIPVVKAALERTLGAGKVEVLSQGASSGLFGFVSDQPDTALKAVREVLAKKQWQHATFVVDLVEKSDFSAAREQLIAANRWRQMQSSSLAVPPAASSVDWSQPACDLDGLRPVGTSTLRKKKLSDNTSARREYGREQKQNFYKKITRLNGLPTFAHDFESIAVDSEPLNGKLAVFYADGNGFGGIQTKHCTGEESQKKWDDLVRGRREAFLKAFLEEEVGLKDAASLDKDSPWRGVQPGEKDKDDECLRFETLLWGGDEFLFVMPAALGWRFAAFFFEQMKELEFADETLTHAAALVFCQHHSPIHRIQHLAKDQIAEFAKGLKDAAGKPIGRERDSLMVVALESFDHLGTEFEKAMADRYQEVQALERMIFAPAADKPLHTELTAFAEGVQALRESDTFARSQLRGLVNEMLNTGHSDATARIARAKQIAEGWKSAADPTQFPPRHFRNADPDTDVKTLATLLTLFGNDHQTLWLQLEELWDYARP